MGFLEDLKEKTLIGDGAIGTLLYIQGIQGCYEELNISNQEKVKLVHKAYIDAGANVIQTNTYAANSLKLSRYGLENKLSQINKNAVTIAKAAVGNSNCTVLGTVGGVRGFQKGKYSIAEISEAFQEQLEQLLLTDVDGLILETYYDFEELKACMQIARRLTDIPIVANVSLDEVGVLHGGILLKDALYALEDLGADVVGMNCRMGPFHMLRSFEEIPLLNHAYLSAYPNASLPDYQDGRLVYQTNPQYFGDSAKELYDQGVRLIGGCCGTTPDHIKAACTTVKGRKPVVRKEVREKETQRLTVKSVERQEPLQELVKRRKSVIVELDPPKQLQIQKFLGGAKELKRAGADAVTLADNSLASPRVCNLSLASLAKNKHNVRPLVHLTCRDRNLIGLQSHLMGLHSLGINDILAITGDPTKIGDFPGATSVYDLASFDLIRLIKQMNNGYSFSGKSLGEKTSFSVSAAFNPNVKHLDQSVKRLERKIECGADYFLSQPVYCEQQIEQIYEATKHLSVPIYLGIMPLTSSRNAEFLHNEVPGIKLTDHIRKRMAGTANDPVSSQKEGIRIAKELIDQVHSYFDGLYLITPFLRSEMTVELTKYWKAKEEETLSLQSKSV